VRPPVQARAGGLASAGAGPRRRRGRRARAASPTRGQAGPRGLAAEAGGRGLASAGQAGRSAGQAGAASSGVEGGRSGILASEADARGVVGMSIRRIEVNRSFPLISGTGG
jgi:hypothetical protein